MVTLAIQVDVRIKMKSITKIKHLLWDNDLTLSITDSGEMEMIITNKKNNVSSFTKGRSWTTLLKNVLKDSTAIEKINRSESPERSVAENQKSE
jgi:hypothetical protein